MRKRFESQIRLGCLPIQEVEFGAESLKSRDELPPTLMALHHIFMTPDLNERIFWVLEQAIGKDKKATGRTGMDYWHLLVFAIVRHTLGTNWDRLLDMANNHRKLREILGVHQTTKIDEEYIFKYRTMIDNVSLLDEETLLAINQIVVDCGLTLLKKKLSEPLIMQSKTDSYVLETNIHFPTDLNLLWDSVRKCFDIIEKANKSVSLKSWRKVKSIRSKVKTLFRSTSQIVFKGKREEAKKQAAGNYIEEVRKYSKRIVEVEKMLLQSADPKLLLMGIELNTYNKYALKFMDQIERRIIKNETIPSSEKVYSIFEPDTEWITKGKLNKKVELGHLLLITTDQNNLIIDYSIMIDAKDAAQVKPVIERLQNNYSNFNIESMSFDKGFYSKENYEIATAAGIEKVIMPKKGNKNKAEAEREGTKEFRILRNKHSAIESTINMLEHHGLNRCPDKGIENYKRYVGLSVMAVNLHLIGNKLLSLEREKLEKSKSNRLYKRAA